MKAFLELLKNLETLVGPRNSFKLSWANDRFDKSKVLVSFNWWAIDGQDRRVLRGFEEQITKGDGNPLFTHCTSHLVAYPQVYNVPLEIKTLRGGMLFSNTHCDIHILRIPKQNDKVRARLNQTSRDRYFKITDTRPCFEFGGCGQHGDLQLKVMTKTNTEVTMEDEGTAVSAKI
jgi:hypothetical protein